MLKKNPINRPSTDKLLNSNLLKIAFKLNKKEIIFEYSYNILEVSKPLLNIIYVHYSIICIMVSLLIFIIWSLFN